MLTAVRRAFLDRETSKKPWGLVELPERGAQLLLTRMCLACPRGNPNLPYDGVLFNCLVTCPNVMCD